MCVIILFFCFKLILSNHVLSCCSFMLNSIKSNQIKFKSNRSNNLQLLYSAWQCARFVARTRKRKCSRCFRTTTFARPSSTTPMVLAKKIRYLKIKQNSKIKLWIDFILIFNFNFLFYLFFFAICAFKNCLKLPFKIIIYYNLLIFPSFYFK